ncbi:MAG: PAS domain-containing protein, partial [Nocardioidaceae bacterium]|nr:PAS domain-containing protein [Nocardioidaceae bacterium]
MVPRHTPGPGDGTGPPAAAPWDADLSLLDQLLGQAPLGMALVDAELRCVWLNDALERSGGIPRAERIGKRLSEVLPGLPTDTIEARMRSVLETGKPLIDHEYRGRTASDPDHDHAYSTSFFRVDDTRGHPIGVCYVVVDVTDRWRARQRMNLLNEAGMRIGTSLDVARTAQELADVAVPGLADFAAVDLRDPVLRGVEP